MKSKQDEWLLGELKGHAFDDFLDPPGWGTAKSRKGLDLRTQFSQHINLNIPLVSANMDTVTGARMAIAMGRAGGIGIIHRYLTIEDQCVKVKEVKRAENFVIEQPYDIGPTATINEARALMRRHKVGGLVVVDGDHKLVGMLSGRDVRFCEGSQLVSNRMTLINQIEYGLGDITFEEAKKRIDNRRLEKLPLIDPNNGHLIGLITAKDIESIERYPLANKDRNGQLMVGAAIGATGDYLERAGELIKAGVDVVVMDIANAQSDIGLDPARVFRKRFSDIELVVGNIAIGMAVSKYQDQDLNVNSFKVGLGPGSACTTRYHTNIGVTQSYAIYDCSRMSGVPIIADGGIRRDGHIFLSLMLGGSSVMIGGLFGGTDEAPGHVVRNSKGNRVKKFRGMASREAMFEKLVSEFADDPYETSSRISPEGIEKELEYKGSVVPIIHDMMNHLASSISYIGAKSLKEAQEIFMASPEKYLTKISPAAQVESWRRDI